MADNLSASALDETYQHATDCLEWLGQIWFSFDPEINARLGRRACDGLGEKEVKMLSLCYPLQQWLDAGTLPIILSSVNPAPIERLGITASSVHQLVKELVGSVVLRVCEVVHPGSTRDFSTYWGRSDLPSLGYSELENADRFAVSDAIRLEPLYQDGPGLLIDEDFTWLAAALFQEYARAKQLLPQVDAPAATANDNENDKKEKYIRPLTTEARDCIRKYRTANKGDEKTAMKDVVEQYVADNGGSSVSIMRTLNDHSNEWKS